MEADFGVKKSRHSFVVVIADEIRGISVLLLNWTIRFLFYLWSFVTGTWSYVQSDHDAKNQHYPQIYNIPPGCVSQSTARIFTVGFPSNLDLNRAKDRCKMNIKRASDAVHATMVGCCSGTSSGQSLISSTQWVVAGLQSTPVRDGIHQQHCSIFFRLFIVISPRKVNSHGSLAA